MDDKPKKLIIERNLIFTDVETTHLRCDVGEIISLACIVMDPMFREVTRGQWFMHPRWPGAADSKALEVNGYTRASWEERGVTTHDRAMSEYAAMAEGGLMVAHNVAFDWSFIECEMRRQNVEWAGDYHRLDTASMFWPRCVWLRGELTGVSLNKLCEYYGISNEGAHDAMTDVERMVRLYGILMGYLEDPHDGTTSEASET